MTLNEALVVLADAHTHSDSEIGFCVHQMPPWYERGDGGRKYVDAWKAVRVHLGLPVEPSNK